jgi:ribosomal protein L37AE/L43A
MPRGKRRENMSRNWREANLAEKAQALETMKCPNCGSSEVECWATRLCACRKCGKVWQEKKYFMSRAF